jgi:hypothetical protein
MKNMGTADRIIRLFIASAVLVLSFFWLGGILSYIGYVIAAIMFLTAVSGFCPLYKPFGICTLKDLSKKTSARSLTIIFAVLAGFLIATGAASHLITQKLFIKDFNAMNNYYKQALFLTGQDNREKAVENFDRWFKEYSLFAEKYTAYKPLAIRGDSLWKSDVERVFDIIKKNETVVREGELKKVHLELEKVRLIFQEMFKRNGFSMLSLALVDFHEAMETLLDAANAKSQDKVKAVYTQADEKLKAVEQTVNDPEIQTIRKNLDELLNLAVSGKLDALPAKAEELKKSFVKVYLQRG